MRITLRLFRQVALLWTFLLFFFFYSFAQPKDIKFNPITVDQGLASTSVYCITQTNDGFMWVGTQNGLHRYDGYSFKIFNFIPGDSTALSDNWIKALCTDRQGNLWVATSNGLNRYNRETETFVSYYSAKNDPHSLADNNIWALFKDSQGILWIGTNNGMSRYDDRQDRFVSYSAKLPGQVTSTAINAIAEDKKGDLWVGTWGSGVFKFDKAKGTFTSISTFTPLAYTVHQYVKVLKFDQAGRLWIGTQGTGLHLFDPVTKRYVEYRTNPQNPQSISDNAILSLMEDSQGNLWIGTYSGGLNYYNKGTFIRYQSNALEPKSLQGSWITSLFEDQSGVIWAGHDNGLSKFDLRGQKFLLFQNNPFDKNSVPKSNINVIFEDRDGLVWIGTWGGGLCSYDMQTSKFTRYENNREQPQSLTDNRVWAMVEDTDGTFWIATSGGLDHFNKHTGIFHHINDLSGDYKAINAQYNTLSYIVADQKGRFWIGSWGGGLYVYDPIRKTTIHLKNDPEDANSLSNNQIKHILIDSKGTAWVSTSEGGLNRLTLDNQNKPTFRHFMYDSKSPKGLGSNSPMICFEDHKKRLWVGTEGSGLSWYNPKDESFNQVKSSGAAAFMNSVFGILEDRAGSFWLSTSRGIVHYYPESGETKVYDVMDGLQSNSFYAGHCKTRKGALLFGGHNGFNMFYPDRVKESRFSPPVLLTELKVFNQTIEVGKAREDLGETTPLLTKPLFLSPEIKLSYKDYVLSIGFTALDFTAPNKNRYAYMLENFEEKWNYTDATQRFATYTNLKPGEYLFKVKGTNSDGVWNEQATSIRVIVTPPFWQTWWAYCIYLLMVIGILVLLRRITIRRERLKNELELKRIESEKLLEVDQMKTRFFTNISHEFRTPLTLILGPLERKLSQMTQHDADAKEFRMMQRNARRLLQLINQLLDISKLESGNIKLEQGKGDLLAFMKSIVFSFSSLADSKHISLNLHTALPALPAYFDKDKLEKIVSNLLSNAFKFTLAGGSVSVNIQFEPTSSKEGILRIAVEDTGIGIPADRLSKIFNRFYQVDGSHTREQGGTGIGLALTRELVILHQGEMDVRSEEGKGTCFTLQLPIVTLEANDESISLVRPSEDIADALLPDGLHVTERPEAEQVGFLGEQVPLLLIVEDNEEVRRYIRETFDTLYRIIEAGNGQEGLDKAIESIPDLIISDLMMPKMDGIELCRHLKTDERTSHIPVILLTARASVESKLDGLETGADEYLTKPFHPQELKIRVKNLIEGRKSLRARFGREVKLQPKDIAITSADERFLQNAIAVVEKYMGYSEFSVERLESELVLSKMQLYRKLRGLTDQSPTEFIRTLRLKRAASLITQKSGNISEIAYEVGFNNLSYFAKCFRELHGVSPSEYANVPKDVAV